MVSVRAQHPCATQRGLYSVISRSYTLEYEPGSDLKKILDFVIFNTTASIYGKIILETEKYFEDENQNKKFTLAETPESAILSKSHENFV